MMVVMVHTDREGRHKKRYECSAVNISLSRFRLPSLLDPLLTGSLRERERDRLMTVRVAV